LALRERSQGRTKRVISLLVGGGVLILLFVGSFNDSVVTEATGGVRLQSIRNPTTWRTGRAKLPGARSTWQQGPRHRSRSVSSSQARAGREPTVISRGAGTPASRPTRSPSRRSRDGRSGHPKRSSHDG
jgi:hypothetical protein